MPSIHRIRNAKFTFDVLPEILLLENAYKEQTAYRFEDFFWTGSGDDVPDDEENWTPETTTIYKTKTVVSTVFIESPQSPYNEVTEVIFILRSF